MLYRYCGRLLNSELPLPELPAVTDSAVQPELSIVFSSLPPTLEGASYRTDTYQIANGEVLWQLDGIARYRVSRGGRFIEVEPDPDADAASVRLFLLQPVFALASILRGDWLLAAAAVERDGQVVAFIGPSGSGKSTAAAALVQRGWRLVSDSLLRVAPDANGCMLAYPQAPWLHLWPDAVAHLGLDTTAGEALRPGIPPKRLAFQCIEEAQPLVRIAVLREQKGDDLELFESVSQQGGRAIELLVHQVAGNTWVEAVSPRQALFFWATRIAQQAKVKRLDIPKGWDHLDALAVHLFGHP